MTDVKLAHLKRVPIFSQCSRVELQALERNTDEVTLPAGRTLITQGETNHTFYILVEGEVDIIVNGQRFDRLSAGDVVGEISMLDRGLATATVITTSAVEALVMSHAQFRDAIQSHEDIVFKVMAVMAERLRKHDSAGI